MDPLPPTSANQSHQLNVFLPIDVEFRQRRDLSRLATIERPQQCHNVCPTTKAPAAHAGELKLVRYPQASFLSTNAVQAQCRVFSNTFNPDGIRTGNKILRQRLRGPALAAYYPRRFWTLKGLADTWGPELQMLNEEADDRLEALDRYVLALQQLCAVSLTITCSLKLRGKGAPKKKKGPPGTFRSGCH